MWKLRNRSKKYFISRGIFHTSLFENFLWSSKTIGLNLTPLLHHIRPFWTGISCLTSLFSAPCLPLHSPTAVSSQSKLCSFLWRCRDVTHTRPCSSRPSAWKTHTSKLSSPERPRYCPLAWAWPQFHHHQVRGPHAVHRASVRLYAWDCFTGKENWSFHEGLQSPAHSGHTLPAWAQGSSSSPLPLLTLPFPLFSNIQASSHSELCFCSCLCLEHLPPKQSLVSKTFSKSPILNHYPYSYFNTLLFPLHTFSLKHFLTPDRLHILHMFKLVCFFFSE